MARRYGMLIDLRKCVGCEACTVTCKAENDVPLGHFRTRVQKHEAGTFPNVSLTFIPTLCNHCVDPACVKVCPTGASIKRSEDGIVLVNQDDCIGCQYCVPSCPYDARYYDEEKRVVDKCTYCLHRVESGVVPSCANTCVADARIFGDLNDPESQISKAVAQPGVVRLAGTSTYYIPPQGLDRSVLPPDYKTPGPIGFWQDLLQPAGKLMLGGAAAAIVAGVALNAKHKPEDGDKEG